MLVTECSHGGDTSRTQPAGRACRRPPCDHADRSPACSAVQPSCVFLVNCGAMVNLEQWLSLGEYPGLVMCVADSHRPVDLSNLDADEDSNYKVRHHREIYTNSTPASATAAPSCPVPDMFIVCRPAARESPCRCRGGVSDGLI
jgi:hypothetical protein